MLVKSSHSFVAFAACSLLFVTFAQSLSAATVTLSANRDNLLMQTTYAADTPPQSLNSVNQGAEAYMQLGTAGGNDTNGKLRYIVGFDESALPAFDQINSVTLRMFHRNHAASTLAGSTPFTIDVHAISSVNANWVEGVGLIANSATWDSGSNWNYKSEPGAQFWAGGTGVTNGGLTSAGLDYEVTALASQTFNAIPADGAAIDFVFTGSSAALTNLIANWDTVNPGFVLFHTTPTHTDGNRRLFFHTRDASDLNLRPQLIVDFTAPVPVPEPSSIGLFGLGMLFVAKRRKR